MLGGAPCNALTADLPVMAQPEAGARRVPRVPVLRVTNGTQVDRNYPGWALTGRAVTPSRFDIPLLDCSLCYSSIRLMISCARICSGRW
jgi:hypothetical protein